MPGAPREGLAQNAISPTVSSARFACNLKWLKIYFHYRNGLPAEVTNILQSVSNYYNCQFTEDITVHINFDYQPLASGILAQASRDTVMMPYKSVRSKLLNKTNFEAKLMQLHPVDDTISLFSTGGVRIVSQLQLTRANAKALGLLNPNDGAEDSAITFSSSFAWSFDEFQGIPNTYSLFSVIVHEVGHALGFVSGVDSSEVPTLLDAYRHSDESLTTGRPSISWLPDEREPTCDVPKYFFTSPIDMNPNSKTCVLAGGCNKFVEYSKGKKNGCDSQGSHWRDGQNIGIMDPTFAPQEFNGLSGNDILAFFYMGWTPSDITILYKPGQLPGPVFDCSAPGANCVELP